MGQALRKLRGGRVSTAVAPSKAQQATESRFQDPSLRGHLPGDVHPDAPYPFLKQEEKEREWDRSDPMYATMVKDLAKSVKPAQGPGGASEEAYMRRPLPKIRHGVNMGFEEDHAVAPGTLNVGHIRQIFLLYQGLLAGEEPMSVGDLAKKYGVDAVLLEKVLRFHALPDKRKGSQEGTKGAPQLDKSTV